MTSIFTLNPNLLYLFAGLWITLGYLFPAFWPLVVVGIAVWLFGVLRSKSLTQVALGSLWVGFAKYGAAIAFLWQTHETYHFGISNISIFHLGTGIVWVYGALVLALGFVLLGLFLKQIAVIDWLLFPPLFVISEILSSIIFSFAALGAGSDINASFTFGYSGYLLADIAILYPVAKWGGVYLLSGIMAFLGWLLFTLIHFSLYRRFLIAVFIILMSVSLAWYFLDSPTYSKPLGQKIIVVDSYFDADFLNQPNHNQTKINTIVEAVLIAGQQVSDIVLLPEDSRLTKAFTTPEETLAFLQTKNLKTKLVVDSARTTIDLDSAVLRAYIYDLANNSVYYIDKQYLVPQGEYNTNFALLTTRMLGLTEPLARMERNQNYVPGPKDSYASIPNSIPTVLFCFGNADPLSVRKMHLDKKYNLVLHPVSHARFNNPEHLWWQTDAMLRIQSIWNQVTIVSAGNMSPSKVYYPNGQISPGVSIAVSSYWRLVMYEL